MNKIVSCIGHTGRASKDFVDRGAASGNVIETDCIIETVAAFDLTFVGDKKYVHVMTSDGSYSERASRHPDASAFLNWHFNAGGGNRTEIYYDSRSVSGKTAANKIAEKLRQAVPWEIRVLPCSATESENCYGCISFCFNMKPYGLVMEVQFVDGPPITNYRANYINKFVQAVHDGL